MKNLRHLFRQPLKTVTGIILVTLAVSILCVSVGQAFAVRMTQQKMNHEFTTVAMLTNTYTVPEDVLSWLNKMAEEHPDVIKMISEQGFLSSYIPGMKTLNYSDPEDGIFYDTGITPQYGDKLITLSTCEYSQKNGRLVIVAKRIT